MSQYHYLVAGFPDISLDDNKLQLTYIAFIEELLRSFSGRDADLLRLFRLDYDNENLLSWINNKEAEFHPLGLISPEDLKEQMEFSITTKELLLRVFRLISSLFCANGSLNNSRPVKKKNA